jgi:tol-pal system protein YbgF
MRRRLQPALLPALLAALLAAGCVSSTRGVSGAPVEPTRSVDARLAELERQAKVAEVEVRRLRVQVAELEAALESGSSSVNAAPRYPSGAVSPPEPPPAVVGGAHSEVESSDLVLEGHRPLEGAVRTRPPGLGAAAMPESTSAGAEVARPVDAEAQALYDRGYTLYHQERYVDAETTFQRFLQANGDTDLADNALYWIGESRFARSDWRGALAAFDETAERFPDGNKVPDALLKAGECLVRLGDRERARASFEEVLRRFPASAAAERARERLTQLR